VLEKEKISEEKINELQKQIEEIKNKKEFPLVEIENLKNKPEDASVSVLPHSPNSLVNSLEITCTYPQMVTAVYHEQKIKHELAKPESTPMIFTFSEIKEDVAKIKFIDSSRIISEAPLIKLFEDEDKIVFAEGNGNFYFTIHTIYKNEGVSLYSKQVSLVGIPLAITGMGTCIGY
jgi:hypothetical protein